MCKEKLTKAKHLRINMTHEEKLMWFHLRASQFQGLKFRRQVPIGNYIVDFVCIDKMLILEIDGGGHNILSQEKYDVKRTEYLNDLGYTVLRFWNNDVRENITGVFEEILNYV